MVKITFKFIPYDSMSYLFRAEEKVHYLHFIFIYINTYGYQSHDICRKTHT